jgi:hypothetical protein
VTRILAIDPGNAESAWVLIDADTRHPVAFGKQSNDDLLTDLYREQLEGCFNFHAENLHHAAIEMVASYGMAVGADVFETCVWIGRFQEALGGSLATHDVQLVKRHPIKLHHCKSARANDSNIRQALTDRFAPGVGNYGKGNKAQPGWFYGFFKDIWQAYALAVYVADVLAGDAA